MGPWNLEKLKVITKLTDDANFRELQHITNLCTPVQWQHQHGSWLFGHKFRFFFHPEEPDNSPQEETLKNIQETVSVVMNDPSDDDACDCEQAKISFLTP